MIAVLLKVETVPVLCVANAEDKVNHFAATTLDGRDGGGGVRVEVRWRLVGRLGGLREDARSVGESVADRGAELPENLSEGFFELIVDNHVLIHAEVGGRELGKGGNAEVRVLVPVWRRDIWSLRARLGGCVRAGIGFLR